MPILSRIAIYPVKSLDPVWVEKARVLASGALENDRRWSIVNGQGDYVNGKSEPLVHKLRITRFCEGSSA
ncbi:MAG: MOSC N-terminal beta barrel domain-containing protein [Planctomycetaceae bacterium]